MKVNGSKTAKGSKKGDTVEDEIPEQEQEVEVQGDDVADETVVKEDEVDEQEEVVNALGRDVRDALALVLSQ